MPYAFASHFAPDALLSALDIYRKQFKPSPQLDQPYAMAGVNVVAAETDDEARRLFTTVQQSFTNLVRGAPGKLQAPIDDIDQYWNAAEKYHARRIVDPPLTRSCALVSLADRPQTKAFLEVRSAVVEIVRAAVDEGRWPAKGSGRRSKRAAT